MTRSVLQKFRSVEKVATILGGTGSEKGRTLLSVTPSHFRQQQLLVVLLPFPLEGQLLWITLGIHQNQQEQANEWKATTPSSCRSEYGLESNEFFSEY